MNICNSHYSEKRGITIVEILVSTGVLILIVSGLIFLMTGFRRSFDKGEESVVVLQESALFLSTLRNDLVNAIPDRSLPVDKWREHIKSSPTRLAFNVFSDSTGGIAPVVYDYSNSSIKRTASGKSRVIVNGHAAAISWNIAAEELTGTASGVKRLWIDFKGVFSGKNKPGKAETSGKTIKLETKLFPVRLIRAMNRS
ncbi:MAG: hypothetical protein HQM10_01195 [Candidatus Riflebacteria bacterium]|nr:hypothetical protein [Candidatus Riflebacteria bacterium]